MRIRRFLTVALAGSAFAAATLGTSPAGATAPSILEIVAASGNDNPAGALTDRRWSDFDILRAAVLNLPGLADAVTGLNGATVFAPADASFRGLVADLTNQPVWKLSEAQVLQTLLDIAANPNLNGSGIAGADALVQTVLYHVSPEKIPSIASRRVGIPTANTVGSTTIRPVPFFGTSILRDGDRTDFDPFVVGRPIAASNGIVYPIAGVLRPLDLVALFPGD